MIYVIDTASPKVTEYEYFHGTWEWWEMLPIHANSTYGAHLTKMFHLSDNDAKVMVF
jgi:hypothetical protein